MYIKTLTLRGFLSYKDATTIRFDPGFNVIVGPNGSGKSSLLAAIQFAMGESSVDKLVCLHQGSSSKVLVGYVSLVLDNSDKRMTGIDDAEITIRRDFSAKKDELLLNGKRVTRNELQGTLEAAGFSRTNPYYFAHQHEVALLTRMSHTERLKVLKESAGTGVYDERRAEAISSLYETQGRRIAIDSTLNIIIDRMNELKEEQTELRQFLDLEKEKNCLASVFAGKDLEDVNTTIKKLQSIWIESDTHLNENNIQLSHSVEELGTLHKDHENAQQDYSFIEQSLEECRNKIIEIERETTRNQFIINDRSLKFAEHHKNIARKESDIQDVKNQMIKIQNDLNKQLPVISSAQITANSSETRLLQHQQELNQLLSRTQRAKQFSSIVQRNKALSKEVKANEEQLKTLQRLLEEADLESKQIQNDYDRDCANVKTLTVKMQHEDEMLNQIQQHITEYSEKHSSIILRRDTIHNEIEELGREIKKYETNLRYAQKRRDQTMRPSQLSANQAAIRWGKETGNTSVIFGSLLENIEVETKYHIAVETAGAGQIFNLLVQDRNIAVTVVEYIKKHREGCTTVTPLNDILTRNPRYPKNQPGVIPLIDVIKCSEHIKPAVQQVFGKYLLVENRDLGNQFKNSELNCITLEGDSISRFGTLTGGYRGNQTRIASQTEVNSCQSIIANDQKKVEDLKKELSIIIENDVLESAENSKHHIEFDKLRLHKNQIMKQIQMLEKNKYQLENRKKTIVTSISELETQIHIIKEEIQRIRREIASPTVGELTRVETERLQDLDHLVEVLEVENNRNKKKLQLLQIDEQEKKNVLTEVLVPRLQKLEEERLSMDFIDDQIGNDRCHESNLRHLQSEYDVQIELLKKTKNDQDNLEQRRQHLLDNVNEMKERIQELSQLKEKHQRMSDQLASQITVSRKKLDELEIRREHLLSKQQNIVGSADLIQDLSRLSITELSQRLATVNTTLRSYKDVNRKALDQFSSFIDEEEKLKAQRQRLYKSEDSILQLIKSLDEKKDITLIKTFENVNHQFGKIFKDIVPGGKAKLVLKKMADEDIARLVENESTDLVLCTKASIPTSTVDAFTGVSVKVQFPTFKGYLPLDSLSGGQKSAVALALLFALQNVESAPFYVLDEIDAHLDSQYRGAVAQLIKEQAKSHQIIVISHKSQMIQSANWFLKTCLSNQTTSVTPISKEDALATCQRTTTVGTVSNLLVPYPHQNIDV